jgi:polar amino acid transport system substrate-binding protein
MDPRRWKLPVLCLLLLASSILWAQEQPAPRQVSVAAASCPPFVIVEDGQFSGLAIYLWQEIAARIGLQYQITEYAIGDMLTAISEPRQERIVDVGMSCLSVTAERERIVNFSHSFYETYIGIAVKQRSLSDAVLAIFTNTAVLKGVALILLGAGLVGSVFFALERHINPKLYSMKGAGGKMLEAFIVGILFITRGPINFYEFKTLSARSLAAVLAIGGTFIIAAFTAIMASAFTLENLRTQVTGLQDLSNVRVGALQSSTSSEFLQRNGIAHVYEPDLETLVARLERGQLDAVVADEAFLRFALLQGKAQGKYQDLSVLPYEFDNQNYGFALVQGGDLLEAVNLALLEIRRTPEWHSMVKRYLGG